MSGVVLSNPFTVLGSFLLGGSTDALTTFANGKRVIGEMRELVPLSGVDRKETGPDFEAQFLMKASVVSPDPELIETFSSLFREKHVEAVSCANGPAAIDQFSTRRFEAIVLDFEKVAESADFLRRVCGMNHRVLLIAAASDDSRKQNASTSVLASWLLGLWCGRRSSRYCMRPTAVCFGTVSDISDLQ